MRRRDGRAGFTLLEILVAIMIASMTVLAARMLLEEVADDAQAIVTHAIKSDADANAERVLRDLVRRLEVGTHDSTRFTGHERIARFSSWCEVPAGWLEPCKVTLAVDTHGREPVLAAVLSTGELLVLRRGFPAGELRFIADAARGGTWLRSWGESITAPVAIGLVVERDTLILRIGERG